MLTMLRKLRVRLSLLYLAAATGLVILLAGGTYGLLTVYFQRSTDLALQYKMALEFRTRGLILPPSLVAAEQAWQAAGNPASHILPTTAPSANLQGSEEEEESGGTSVVPSGESEDRYDGSLAPVFILPTDTTISTTGGAPSVNSPAAVSAALQNGSDLRTVRTADGMRVRLLTYRVDSSTVLQVGRLLSDQDRLLSQYLIGLVILGCVASFLLALVSWWLAGSSIAPAQRAWDRQQQFISNASHELRAPLTIMRANADYALRKGSDDDYEKALRTIVGEVDYMNRMVEDQLLLSRLDSHRLALKVETVNTAELLTEIVHQVEKVAEEKKIALLLAPTSGSVSGDPVRLRQVLLILLDNALRFTPLGGTIHLGANIQGKRVSLYVADNGKGIPAKDLPHIFERFYQVPGQAGENRGNGLGLSIAKSLVEAQHGTISISSTPGKGTAVMLQFPLA
jgi:signal transduction histidine kinase